MMNRRGLLRGILAAGMAPAVAKAGILMPVKKVWSPGWITTEHISQFIANPRTIKPGVTVREVDISFYIPPTRTISFPVVITQADLLDDKYVPIIEQFMREEETRARKLGWCL